MTVKKRRQKSQPHNYELNLDCEQFPQILRAKNGKGLGRGEGKKRLVVLSLEIGLVGRGRGADGEVTPDARRLIPFHNVKKSFQRKDVMQFSPNFAKQKDKDVDTH